jgi:hypothetical protein
LLAGANLLPTRKLSIIFALSLLFLAGAALFLTRDRFFHHTDSSLALVRGYLVAVYARDFRTAYPLLAAADRQIRDEARYVASQGQYDGFTLEVSRKLAGFMKVWLIEQKESGGQLVIKVGYRVPAPAELNDLLLNWDQDRLNSLSTEKQKELLAELDARNKAGKILNIEGQETIDLVEGPQGWKIFLDWAAGTRVLLQSKVSDGNKLEVHFATSEVTAKSDELFLVNVKIKNPSAHGVTFTVRHLLEPPAIVDNLQLVECGLLTPTTLDPQQEKEFAMAYLLEAAGGKTHREVKLTYEFKLQ